MKIAAWLFSIALAIPSVTFAKQENKKFVVNDEGRRDTIRFILDAPFEVINGTTNDVTGAFQFENGKLSGNFKVSVASIKTGIETRDEHLQNDKWLDAAKYPTLELKITPTKVPDTLWKGTETTVEIPGEFTIHGVKKTEKLKIVLRYFPQDETTQKRLPGNLLRAKAEFQIQLADYGIAQSDSKVKELLGLKVGKTAAITADLMASDKLQL